MPWWLPVLLAAEEWKVAPWVIEADATAEWWERWKVLHEERANLPKKGRKPEGGVTSD